MNDYVYSFAVEPDELLSQVLLLLAMAVLTTILEAPFVLIGFRKSEYKHKVLLLILVNSLTNIVLNSILLAFMHSFDWYWTMVFILEVLVVVSEAVLYRVYIKDLSPKRIAIVCILANLFSFVLGYFILALVDSAFGLYMIFGF